MDPISRMMIGRGPASDKKDITWNMIGSLIYAMTSMFLGIAVTRILGADQGGIFFFAFSTFGQQMFIIAYFGMRPIQVTDTSSKYSFGDYRTSRYITCIIAVVVSLLYILFFVEEPIKRAVIFIMVLYKVADGFADCYESEYQRQGRLYMTGISCACRTIISVVFFLGILIITRNLWIACLGAVAGEVLGIYLLCIRPSSFLEHIDYNSKKERIKKLYKECGWLFLAAFLDLYIFAAAKYAVDAHMEAAYSGYFSTIFIPTSVINLMAGFVIRPVLTKLSRAKQAGDMKTFNTYVLKISLLIVALTACGMVAAAVAGIPVLSWVLGPVEGLKLAPYTMALIIVICGGGFYAILNLLYYVLVILERQISIFIIYIIGCVVAYLMCNYGVMQYGIDGAAWSYLMVMMLMAAMFCIAVYLPRRKS